MVGSARRRGARILVATLAALAAASCGAPPPPPKPAVDRLYRGLAVPMPHLDPTRLKGFRVLIDPGHGGSFRGTLGPDSLQEKDVNLGVALYLWGLLHDSGADVYLTRAVDRDFLTALDSSLTSDLKTRVDMADSLRPDLFISIHHNAQPDREPSMNRVETYYRAGDPASLDLAFAIHRHLMQNLGIDVGEVQQGNYYVLRNVDVPAVLGESSYLTNPPVERKLRLSRTQQLEGEAYFLGIMDYCERGIPRVTAISPVDSVQTSVPTIACRFEDRGGLGIDPDGVGMVLNGAPVTAVVAADGRSASYCMPWDSPNGGYEVDITARNLLGNTSTIGRKRFSVVHPPAMAAIDPSPERVPRGGGSIRVRARILDRRGLPVADGTPVTMSSSGSRALATQAVRDGAVEFVLDLTASGKAVTLDLECGGVHFARELPLDAKSGARQRSIAVENAATRAPVLEASVVVGDSVVVSGSPTGTYGFAGTGSGARVLAPGFRPAALAGGDTLSLQPWFGGALLGKRFVLDPQGGPARSAGVGALGLSGAHVNLRVAVYLAGYLREAGADVRLTRTSEEVRLAEDVVQMTNRFHADRYVEIRHPSLPADSALALRTYYFPGSANGQKMARAVGVEAARRLGVPFLGPASTVTYPLQQTACPALAVAAPQLSVRDEELRLDRASYLREQAYAVFVGLLRAFGVTEAGTLTVEVGTPVRTDWVVTLDDTWTLDTRDDGRVTFELVPPGPHDVSLRRGGRNLRQSVVVSGPDAHLVVDATAVP